jgi:translation initiation factor 2-alpha kinase 4
LVRCIGGIHANRTRCRYDHLITQLIAPTSKTEPICAFGLQISIERIATTLATYQSTSVTNLVKEQRSFGYWSARRCDVYVVAFQEGHLQERLEVAAMLWQNGISADLMYESGVAEANQESFKELCNNEGIL